MSLAWFLPLPGSYAGVDVVGVYNFACSLREVLAKHPFLPHGCGLFSGSYFPSFSEGLSLRDVARLDSQGRGGHFPFFSEGLSLRDAARLIQHLPAHHFPSFSEGLSLRGVTVRLCGARTDNFPSFSEGLSLRAGCFVRRHPPKPRFPFLFGGTFIEGQIRRACPHEPTQISLPFRRDFH